MASHNSGRLLLVLLGVQLCALAEKMERYRDSFTRFGSQSVASGYGRGAVGVPIMVGGQPYQPQYPEAQFQPRQDTFARDQNVFVDEEDVSAAASTLPRFAHTAYQNQRGYRNGGYNSSFGRVQNVFVDEEDVPAAAGALPRFAHAAYQKQRGYRNRGYNSARAPRFASTETEDEQGTYDNDFVEADDMEAEAPSDYSRYSHRGRAMAEIRKAAGRGFGMADASLPQNEDELMEKAEKLRGRIKKLSFLSSKLKSRMSLTQHQIDEMDKRNMNQFAEGDNKKARDILRDVDVFGETDDILEHIEASDKAISDGDYKSGFPRFAAKRRSKSAVSDGSEDERLGMGLLNDKNILEGINVDDDDSADYEEESKTLDQLVTRLTK